MSKSMDIKFEDFHKMCRFCFETNIILYNLFEENALHFVESNHTQTTSEHSANILNTSLGLEV